MVQYIASYTFPVASLLHTTNPFPLLVPRHAICARDRQVALLELLLDHLPPADLNLAVDGANLLAVQPDVGQVGEIVTLLQDLGQFLGLGLLGGHGQDVADGPGGAESRVGDEAAGELVQPFANLRRVSINRSILV